MKNPYFGRLLTAMITPFNEDGSVNFPEAIKFSEWLLENGTDALVVAGTTGEAPTMSVLEKKELFKGIIDKINGKAPVIVGTGSNNTADSIKLTQMAEELGADGALVVGPYYNKPNQEGYYRHFKAIADATKLPIILYNVPGRTGSNILPETIARITNDCENIVAVKEAGGCVAQVAKLYELLPERVTIYSGDDNLILPFMSVGATGLISVLSNINGQILQDLMQAYENGDIQKAKEINKKMLPLAKAMFISSNPIPVKEAVSLCTPINAGPLRLPLCELSSDEHDKLTNALKAYNLI
jgi:4-hydroxy-tetrahydrodipicolinate synthase